MKWSLLMTRKTHDQLSIETREKLKIFVSLEEKCLKAFSALTNREGALAKTNLEQAFMWANRALCVKQDEKR